MNRTSRLAFAALAIAVLAGCSTGAPAGSDPDPAGDTAAEAPCIVGTWQLDVADYAAQSEAFVLGLGLPIVGFAMSGAGSIQFTADGLVATDIGLTSTGTIVAGGASVPFSTPSSYTGSGDWSADGGSDVIDLANWANVPDPSTPVDPSAPGVPAIDYTDIPSVTAECTANTLVLQAPGAPLAARWQR